MPISRETRSHQRRPWRLDGLPRPHRLGAEQLRRLSRRVHAATRVRVATIDGGRRFAAISDKRCAVIQHVIRQVGWGGRDRLYIGSIAGACDTSEDTVQRALADAEAFGWLRRQAIYRPAEDGTRRRDASVFELLDNETQNAGGSCTTESILPFWRRRRARAEHERERRQAAGVVWLTVEATDAPPDSDKAREVAARCGW